MAKDLSVDDLLKELGDLPHTSCSRGQQRTPVKAVTPAKAAEPIRGPTPPPKPLVGHNPRSSAPTHHHHVASTSGTSETRHAQSASGRSGHIRVKSAVDDLLDDLDDLSLSPPNKAAPVHAYSSPATTFSAPQSHPGPAPKCMGLFVGGSHLQRGRNGSCVGSILCCDHLRCTKCDFKVMWFRDKGWDSGVDYLFFRNNFPTEAKLSSKLHLAPGSCAYCCQCSWQDTATQMLVDFGGDLRWVCAGHS